MDYAKESLRLHGEWKGKIEVVATVPADSKDALSLAYTPGVAQPCLEASGMSEVMDGLLEEVDQGCRSRLSEISLAELDSRLYLKQRR